MSLIWITQKRSKQKWLELSPDYIFNLQTHPLLPSFTSNDPDSLWSQAQLYLPKILVLLIEAAFDDLMLDRKEEHSLGLDIHPSMNLQVSRREDRIAGLSTGEPSSRTSHSTSPHCPMACKLQSMSWDTPVIRNGIHVKKQS